MNIPKTYPFYFKQSDNLGTCMCKIFKHKGQNKFLGCILTSNTKTWDNELCYEDWRNGGHQFTYDFITSGKKLADDEFKKVLDIENEFRDRKIVEDI